VQLSWISEGRTKIVAIVGICKNAGKTTVLNAVLKQHDFSWGVLSTGRDGEREDLVYKTPKPRVLIPRGVFFVATPKAYRNMDPGSSSGMVCVAEAVGFGW
jgi:ABC-type branched-subunit amino acid transport system ATPase component